jgi:hypothetical protein
MSSTRVRVLVAMMVTALVGVVAPGRAGAAKQVQGVTDDTIEIVVLAADLDQLRARGFNLGAQLTTGNIVRRAQAYADLYGPIHGRKLVFEAATWDPLDATTFDKACAQATQDHHPFLVINGNGYRAGAISCITVDNHQPLFLGEAVYADLQRASGKNLVSLALPAEVNARQPPRSCQDRRRAQGFEGQDRLVERTPAEGGRRRAREELDRRSYDVAKRGDQHAAGRHQGGQP